MCGWRKSTHHIRRTRQRQGSSSLVPVGWPLSSSKPMQSEDASTCLPQSPNMRRIKPSGRVSSSSADVTQRDSSPWSVIPVQSQAVIAVPRPPGTFFSGRFAVLAGDQHDDTVVDPIWPTEQDANSTAVDSVHQESDTESVLSEGISEVPESVAVGNPSEVESEFETPVPLFRPSARFNEGFASLDIVNVQDVFSRRICVMKAPPAFFRGAYRSAMRVALQEIVSGMELDNPTQITRGWKLFTLLPRLLLTKPPRGGKVPKNKLLERVQKCASGELLDLLRLSLVFSKAASQLRSRRRSTPHDTVTKRVERADALEGSPAPGTEETLKVLRPFGHAQRAFAPSSLDNAEDCTKFFEISQAIAQAKLPEEIVSVLRIGQMTAQQKATGGIRGIVVGDVISVGHASKELVSTCPSGVISTEGSDLGSIPDEFPRFTGIGWQVLA